MKSACLSLCIPDSSDIRLAEVPTEAVAEQFEPGMVGTVLVLRL